MQLDEKHIADFRSAWKEEFGEELSEGDARIRLQQLVELFLLILKKPPDTEE